MKKRDQEKWDLRYLKLAKEFALQNSKDPSTKVGAILVDEYNHVVGMGYNGFAVGVNDTEERLNDRQTKYDYVVHAEVNAIINAGHRSRGATLYVWPSFNLPPVCKDCCKWAINAGVREIVGFEADDTDERALRWKDSIAKSKIMCDETQVNNPPGVTYRGIPISKELP